MQEESEPTGQAGRSARMRERLVSAARDLFVQKGYADTGTPEIVRAAGVTRGALYHHFSDKADLFRAVVETEADQLRAEIEAGSEGRAPDIALADGSRAFFAAMARPGRVRLMLIDGPAVLGPAEMDRIDAGGGRAALAAGLAEARPDLDAEAVTARAVLLSAAFDRAALAVAAGAGAGPYEAALAEFMSLGTRT
ncbi:TetR family transcriptional regulator [Rhodobacterales bacterium HKCCE2091]|nr:TetR family transcriptional regulator [Rhodobacterales bacterium HKCCE2091]